METYPAFLREHAPWSSLVRFYVPWEISMNRCSFSPPHIAWASWQPRIHTQKRNKTRLRQILFIVVEELWCPLSRILLLQTHGKSCIVNKMTCTSRIHALIRKVLKHFPNMEVCFDSRHLLFAASRHTKSTSRLNLYRLRVCMHRNIILFIIYISIISI